MRRKSRLRDSLYDINGNSLFDFGACEQFCNCTETNRKLCADSLDLPTAGLKQAAILKYLTWIIQPCYPASYHDLKCNKKRRKPTLP